MDGNLLKEARLEKNWTQEQAALALDVTQAYLSMMEKGHRPLSERFVRKALKVLNLPATALPLRSEEVVNARVFAQARFQCGTGRARLSRILLSSKQETTEPRGGLAGGTE